MRRATAVVSVLAIVALAASAVQATSFQFGNYYFMFSNWDNGGGGGSGPAWVLPTGPTATTDGAVWIKTGNTYALNVTDFNAEIDFRDLTTGGTVYVITNTCLLSTGVAYGDVDIEGNPANVYPGYFLGDDGATGWGNNNPDPSPYRLGQGEYWVPTVLNADPTRFQLDLKIWQGTSNSFAAAQAARAYGADSGWFSASDMAVGIAFPTDSTFADMPSLVLQPLTPTPEPATIVLVVSGTLGLLAYAWRRRKQAEK